MSEDSLSVATAPGARSDTLRPWWRDELPYLAMLVLAVAGAGYTSIAPHASALLWAVLPLAFAAICIAAGWPRAKNRPQRWRLIWTQGTHWGALLGCMQLLFLPRVQDMLNTDAIGLALLALLAFGTFLAGVHAASWRICAAAVVMAVAVPLIAFVEQSALLLLPLELLLVAAVVGFIWWRRRRVGQAVAPAAWRDSDF